MLRIIERALDYNAAHGNTATTVLELAPGSVFALLDKRRRRFSVFFDATRWEFKADSQLNPGEKENWTGSESQKQLLQDDGIGLLPNQAYNPANDEKCEYDSIKSLADTHLQSTRGDDLYDKPDHLEDIRAA